MTTTMPKERGIIFSGALIPRLLDDSKTMTRRVVKPQPDPGWAFTSIGQVCTASGKWVFPTVATSVNQTSWLCPYGVPGDRLWVRETWRPVVWGADHCYIEYRTGGHAREGDGRACLVPPTATAAYEAYADRQMRAAIAAGDGKPEYCPEPWRPSIHMPRWASRITLELTDVRVERLQEISWRDVVAEGVDGALDAHGRRVAKAVAQTENDRGGASLYEMFRVLWNGLNAKRGFGWDTNPWVWVLEFKRCER
jgi:hypothetical protein